jgi:hypothetical protein
MERFPSASTARMFLECRGDQHAWPIGKSKLTINWLCQRCNNGWMSRLESRTKPIVESILDEKLTTIDSGADDGCLEPFLFKALQPSKRF